MHREVILGPKFQIEFHRAKVIEVGITVEVQMHITSTRSLKIDKFHKPVLRVNMEEINQEIHRMHLPLKIEAHSLDIKHVKS